MNELVYGINPINVILDNNPKQILNVYIKDKSVDMRLGMLIDKIKRYGIKSQKCSCRWLDNKVHGSLHQGIVAVINRSPVIPESDLLSLIVECKVMPLLLVLDSIIDPHNLGACLRSAYAAGVHAVIVPRDRSVGVNNTVRKVSSGFSECIPFVRVTNLARTLRLLKQYNIWIIGTVVQSSRFVFDSKLNIPLAFVMGSEGNGIRYLIRQICDELISIPTINMDTSLNVSVATGICLFEALRQRNQNRCVVV